MRVLVTGGTGVIGEGLIPALLGAGHTIRLLTRGARRDAAEWPEGVEPFEADVSKAESLEGAATGCDAVVHITGIVSESPPDVTFESVNVEGTKNLLKEAKRAGTERFIYLSSLGADRGRSAYHQSKLRAEELVREFEGEWLILRPGGVYGPGDEVISTFLKLIRTLPLIPVVADGEQRFQPVWFEDVGAAIARAVEMRELSARTLELAGDEIITVNELIDRLSAITGRTPTRIPIPSFIASLGAQLFDGNSLDESVKRVTGMDVPIDEAKLTMLLEENFIREPSVNALVEVLEIEPTPLDEGLKALADLLPEQTISDGVGEIERKRFRADIERSRYDAPALLEEFRARCMEIMPLEFQAEPGATGIVEKGATLTASIPLRGNIQVRVAEATKRRVTFVTLEGHPLAGVVQFKTSALKGDRVRFMVEIHARKGSILDQLAMSVGGRLMQDQNWQEVAERVVEVSGGRAPEGVVSESVTLDEAEAERAEQMVERLVKSYKREAKQARTEAARENPEGKSLGQKPARRRKSVDARASGGGSEQRGAGMSEAVEKVSEAAASLVESFSQALAGTGAKKRGKRAGSS